MSTVSFFIDKPPTLEEAQHLVDGYIELHEMRDGRQMLMNEEGDRLGFELNLEGSQLIGFPVLGHVIVLEGKARWS